MEQSEVIEYSPKNHPIDSLWGKESLVIPSGGDVYHAKDIGNDGYFSSAIVITIIILLVLSFRAIVNIVPLIFKAIFRSNNHAKIEDKLSLINQRGVLFIVSAICLPAAIVLSGETFLSEHFEIPSYLILISALIMLALYWVFKSAILRLCSWITRKKKSFSTIGKIGYNYFIALFFSAIPLFLLSAIPHFIPTQITVNILIILALTIYLLYLVGVFKIIISSRFSHFFYILYLCAAELLPLLFIIKLIDGV